MAPKHTPIPPQDIEAEKALLGSIMLKPNGLNQIADHIREESFYSEKHRLIYQAMIDLYQKNDPIDLLSLATRLKEQKLIESVGGSSYLTELVEMVPSSANLGHYASIIERKHALRSLIDAASHILELGYNEGKDIDEVFDEAEKSIYGVKNVSLKQKFDNIKEGLAEAWDRLDRLHKQTDTLRGIQTGFHDLDSKLAGLQKSDLVILASRPSMGKTSLALDIARQTAMKHNHTVGIFSLEMSSQQLVDRLLAADSRVDAWKLRTGKLSTDEEFSRIRDSLDRLSQTPIFIDDEASNTIIKMRAMARRLASERGLDLIIVDYLQLMVPHRQSDSLVQQVTEISRSLKALARELKVPVLALSQLSRAVEQRRGAPRLSDLRDSGSIEQDADVVIFIHREDKYETSPTKPNIARIIIAKHRNGPTGELELYFDEKRVSFSSIERGSFSAIA